MGLEDKEIEEFLAEFYDNYEDFILRVRDSKKDYNNDDNKNLVYYNGIKAFEIENKNNKPTINFPENVYKLNPTGFNNAIKNNTLIDEEVENSEEGETRERKEAHYREEVGQICEAMNKLFDFKMENITFTINFKENENLETLTRKFYNKIMVEFKEKVTKRKRKEDSKDKDVFVIGYDKSSKLNNKKEDLKKIFDKFSGKVDFTLTFTPQLTTKKEERNITATGIIILQCWFLRYARDIGKVSGIEFGFKSDYKGKRHGTDKDFDFFVEKVKDAIDKYLGIKDNQKDTYKKSKKLEKEYQHSFMLQAHEMKDLFQIKNGEYVDYFEQEYGIYNPAVCGTEFLSAKEKKDKTGRIDCIVYKYKEKNKERIITDIYMIELKVNSDVVLGDNGIMTHLDDINAFLKFKGKSNKKYQYYDFATLKKRIMARIEILSKGSIHASYSDNLINHFYTIIGYTDESEKEEIIKMTRKLCKADEVNKLISDGYRNDYRKKTYKLNKRFRNNTIDSIMPKNCEIRFFIEKNI